MNLVIGLSIVALLFGALIRKRILYVVLFLVGRQAVQSGENGRYKLSNEKFQKHAAISAAAGALFITVPGLYIGRVLALKGINDFLFLSVTFLLLAIFLTVMVLIFKKASNMEPVLLFQAIPPLAISSLLTLVFFAVGVYTGGYFWYFTGKIIDNSVKKDILRAGYCIDLPKNPPKVPDDKNAITFLKKAVEAKSLDHLEPANGKDWSKSFYKGRSEKDFLNDFRNNAKIGKVSLEEMTYARKLLKEHAETLQLVDTAFEKKVVDWGIDYEVQPSWKIELPKKWAYFLNLSRLLACRAIVEAQDGRGKAALNTIRTGLFLGDASRQTQFLIGEMIDVAVCKNMLDATRAILPRVDGKLAEKELIPYLMAKERTDAFLKSTQMEFFGNGWSLENMGWMDFVKVISEESEFDKFGTDPRLKYLFSFFYRPFIFFDMAVNKRIAIKKMKSFDLPFPERKKAWDVIQEEFNHKGWFVGRFAQFNADQMYSKALEAETHCLLARAAVKAKVFYEKNKRWPEAVWELIDDQGNVGNAALEKCMEGYLDPFTVGALLRIQRYKTGIMIYSVGPDGIDNQGISFNPYYNQGSNYTHFDISWIVEK